MTENVLKLSLFYLAKQEIQSRKIQNNIVHILNFPALFSAEFPHSQDKTQGISNFFMSFSTLFLYISCVQLIIHPLVIALFLFIFRAHYAVLLLSCPFSGGGIFYTFLRHKQFGSHYDFLVVWQQQCKAAVVVYWTFTILYGG